MSPEEIKKIETKWKSDVDKKLDHLVAFIDRYNGLLIELAEREVNRKALRKAVIEKSLSGLIWMGVAGIAALIWSGAKAEFTDLANLFKGNK